MAVPGQAFIAEKLASLYRGRGGGRSLPLFAAAILTGTLTGAVCSLFELIPDYLNELRVSLLGGTGGAGVTAAALAAAFLVSFALAAAALYLTRKFAPEAGGSGIPEIEGAMVDLRPVRYKRVLPVKFFGGILSLSSGMILGREGPSIQIGGNLGAAVMDLLRIRREDFYVLLAAGASSGLASAFNAPLAGILFVLEEMRPQFRYRFYAIQAVAVAVICAVMTRTFVTGGDDPVFDLPVFDRVSVYDLWTFLIFGAAAGVAGVVFNKAVALAQDAWARVSGGRPRRAALLAGAAGGVFGALSLAEPQLTGSGVAFIPGWVLTSAPLGTLCLVCAARFLGLLVCFGSGIPGGLFAPSLALGALLGAASGMGLLGAGLLDYDPGILAVVGMCAFFAASVRAPVTGIVLICEMTNNFQFLLPMMIATAAAAQVASALRGRPIYTQILERTLKMSGDAAILTEYDDFKKNNNVE